MKKSNKYYLILLVLFFSILFFLQDSFAKENINFTDANGSTKIQQVTI